MALKNDNNHNTTLMTGDFAKTSQAITTAIAAISERPGVEEPLQKTGRAVELALAYLRRDAYRIYRRHRRRAS